MQIRKATRDHLPQGEARRDFLRRVGVGVAGLGMGLAEAGRGRAQGQEAGVGPGLEERPEFRGRRVMLIRFGGGVRRRETIDAAHTHAPFVCRELAARGTLFPRMVIDRMEGLNTSHGEGTLNILTGRYDRYRDVEDGFLKARYEPKVPTLFEYLRKAARVGAHETLIINGEDRPDEEFYSFSNHAGYGIDYRANVLSLYRFKRWLLERRLAEGGISDEERRSRTEALAKWEQADPRLRGVSKQSAELEAFWERWQGTYGESGLVNPRGDRLLTALARRAWKKLRPRLLMVNYNDCDYVHWGYMSHYTTGIAVMDEGVRELVAMVEADPESRDNTVVVIVPDCGRDSNPLASVPCQHHFNSVSAHEIFALIQGPGIARGTVVDKVVRQVDIAPTVAAVMGFRAEHAEGRVLEEAIV